MHKKRLKKEQRTWYCLSSNHLQCKRRKKKEFKCNHKIPQWRYSEGTFAQTPNVIISLE